MTVSTLTTQNTYSGDGVTVTFAFGFFCLDPAWIVCELSTVPTVAFTAILNANQSTTPGGTVTFTTAPPAGSANILIKRVTPATQLTNYTEYDAFPALSHMSALDKLTALAQDTLAIIGTQAIPPLVAGEFLTNNGSVLLWAPGGGGGGGTDIIGPLIAAAPLGAEITGVSSNVLQLGIADETNPGLLDPGTNPQPIGGVKYFTAGAATNIHDIRSFGALTNASNSSGTNDAITGIEAAIAAGSASLGAFSLYATEGFWFVSRPICLPGTGKRIKFFGDGQFLTQIYPGPGDSTSPAQVQQFAGPLFYVGGFGSITFPTYVGPLVGGTGQAMQLNANYAFWLHDAYAWNTIINTLSSMSLRCWVNPSALGDNNSPTQIVGSRGPVQGNGNDPLGDIGFGMYCIPSTPGNFKFSAFLTTQVSGQQNIVSSSFAIGTTHNIEMDYNGAFFDFYVDGVNQGHLATTGVILRQPWEGVSIGFSGPEFSYLGIQGIYGVIDSIELASVARHTGTGSFVPPVAKYTADSNTLGLINFDQGAPPGLCANNPFIMGQSSNGGTVLVPHFIRFIEQGFGPGANLPGTAFVEMEDFQVNCRGATSGIVAYQTSNSTMKRLFIFAPTMFGLDWWDPGSFYNYVEDISVEGSNGTGLLFYGNAKNITTVNCRIGGHYVTGLIKGHQDQPGGASVGPPFWQNNSSFFPFIAGPSIEGSFNSFVTFEGCSIDAESLFPTMKAGVLVFGALGNFRCKSNIWSTLGCSYAPTGIPGSNGTPSVMYLDAPASGALHENDLFGPAMLASQAIKKQFNFSNLVELKNCFYNGETYPTPVPLTLALGFLMQRTPTQVNNQVGLSTSDLLSNNLVVDFQAIHGQAFSVVRFFNPEPDGNFRLYFALRGFTGTTPATGSLNNPTYTTLTDGTGFNVFFGADPGGSCVVSWTAFLVRVQPPPLLDIVNPTLPSSATNPLVTAAPTGDFGTGMTIVPANGTNFVYNGNGTEVIFQWGAPTTNWLMYGLNGGCQWIAEYNVAEGWFGAPIDSFCYKGRLFGMLNPGPHNLIAAKVNGLWMPTLDGGLPPSPIPINNLTGIQQTPIYIGQNASAGQLLTSAGTARDLKMDPLEARVFSSEPDAGPLLMNQAAFFGDSFTVGTTSTSSNGGFASQIASNRYGTTYYWFACSSQGRAVKMVKSNSDEVGGVGFWGEWGSGQMSNFTGVCVFAGFYDLLYDGASSATVLTALKGFFEGTQATALYSVPGSGTATCVINSISFTATFNTSYTVTANNLIALINASGPTTALVTPSLTTDQFGHSAVLISAVTRVPGGNCIPLSTNGENGAVWYNLALPSGGATNTDGAVAGLLSLGSPPIMALCNIPPFGNSTFYTSGKDTQRTTLNAALVTYQAAHPSITLIDLDSNLRDSSAHQNILASYLGSDNETLSNAGHTVVLGLLTGVLP